MNLGNQIQDLLNNRSFSEADDLLSAWLRAEPENPDATYLQALSNYFQGHLSKTIDGLKKTLALNPNHTDAAISLSVLYNDVGRYDEGKDVFAKANQSIAVSAVGEDGQIDRKFALKHLEVGDLYFRYRRFDEAIEEYTKALSLSPNEADIRLRRAKAFAKKGFPSRALQELEQLKVESPNHIPTWIQLGLLHFSQGNMLDAELAWEGALALDPRNSEARSLIELLRAGNKFARA
jgi:tetratricopeptide (TPR) repeat protein